MSLTTDVSLLPTHSPNRLAALGHLVERTGYDFLWLADERVQAEVMPRVRQELATWLVGAA